MHRMTSYWVVARARHAVSRPRGWTGQGARPQTAPPRGSHWQVASAFADPSLSTASTQSTKRQLKSQYDAVIVGAGNL